MFGAEKGPRKSPAVLTDEVGPRPGALKPLNIIVRSFIF